MKSILLAFSLIRVPKLFVSLLFWPLIIGMAVALTQVIASAIYFGIVTETPDQFEKRITTDDAGNTWIRQKLFNSPKKLGPIGICRWITVEGTEVPPGDSCRILPHEIAIQTSDPTSYDVSEYQELFEGATTKLHICKECQADIVIRKSEDQEIISDIFGLPALGVFVLVDSASTTRTSSDYVTARVSARKNLQRIRELRGTSYLYAPGFEHPINMSQATKTMMLIMNTALITILTLWLSLKGHRKVLDYFARNGALLPLVAACGKDTFYTSLWIITLIRVAFFLMAVLPSTIILCANTIPEETLDAFIGEMPDFILWITGMLASLSSLAIIASIAELKHRHSMVNFMYRYIPIILAIIGTIAWFICIFTPSEFSAYAQKIIASLPVIGISPIIISPLFPLESSTIAAHSLLASGLVFIVLRLNSRWFAAHLEEI